MSNPSNASLHINSLFHIGFMPDYEHINQQIMEAYVNLREQDFNRRTHFFGGRYENLYLERDRISAIAQTLNQAENFAVKLLNHRAENLRSGFWINDMGPTESTSEHNHDDNDELLSGVYYVQVPKNSGDLVIVDKYSRTLVTPQAGMFVFFAPNVLHSVCKNQSEERRISIGMNFGPVPLNNTKVA